MDTAAGVDELLLTGVERMALVAEVDGHLGHGGTRGEGVATGAANGAFNVVGMDALLHVGTPSACLVSDQTDDGTPWLLTRASSF